MAEQKDKSQEARQLRVRLAAELRARMTNAAAAAEQFKREVDAHLDGGGPRPLYEDHAWRLWVELDSLLSTLKAADR